MEADISILRKTGHFYFVLTRTGGQALKNGMLGMWLFALRRIWPLLYR